MKPKFLINQILKDEIEKKTKKKQLESTWAKPSSSWPGVIRPW